MAMFQLAFGQTFTSADDISPVKSSKIQHLKGTFPYFLYTIKHTVYRLGLFGAVDFCPRQAWKETNVQLVKDE